MEEILPELSLCLSMDILNIIEELKKYTPEKRTIINNFKEAKLDAIGVESKLVDKWIKELNIKENTNTKNKNSKKKKKT